MDHLLDTHRLQSLVSELELRCMVREFQSVPLAATVIVQSLNPLFLLSFFFSTVGPTLTNLSLYLWEGVLQP